MVLQLSEKEKDDLELRQLIRPRNEHSFVPHLTPNHGLVIMIAAVISVMILSLYQLSMLEQSEINPNSTLVDLTPLQIIPIDEPIHIAMVITGIEHLNRMATMLKTVLYYQRGIGSQSISCVLDLKIVRNYTCSKRHALYPRRLQIHIMTDSHGENFLRGQQEIWNRVDVGFRFYDIELGKSFVQGIPSVHRGGEFSLSKIALPEMIDRNVEKIMLLDNDQLFNEDISEVWKEFDRFTGNQSIGGVLVQNDIYASFMRKTGCPIYKRGINTGLLLMDLKKLRNVGWHNLWMNALNQLLRYTTRLRAADQDIFNALFGLRSDLLYQLPCIWNVQMLDDVIMAYCPSVWPIRYYDEQTCRPRMDVLGDIKRPVLIANVIHSCGINKPGVQQKSTENELVPMAEWHVFEIDELRETFQSMYYIFYNLPIVCLI